MRKLFFAALTTVALSLTSTVVSAQSGTAIIYDKKGNNLGTVTLRQTPHGVMLRAELSKLKPGGHGFHIHGRGKCKPDFTAASGHYNPTGKAHGLYNPSGHHAGDMPNIYADAEGNVNAEILNTKVSLRKGRNNLFDANGSSIIIHAKPDRHKRSPGVGSKVACGVIRK